MVFAVCCQNPQQLLTHFGSGLLVEGAKRLVHQNDPRVLHETPGDRHALFHSARQLVRIAVGEGVQADELQHLLGAGAAGADIEPLEFQGELYVRVR